MPIWSVGVYSLSHGPAKVWEKASLLSYPAAVSKPRRQATDPGPKGLEHNTSTHTKTWPWSMTNIYLHHTRCLIGMHGGSDEYNAIVGLSLLFSTPENNLSRAVFDYLNPRFNIQEAHLITLAFDR